MKPQLLVSWFSSALSMLSLTAGMAAGPLDTWRFRNPPAPSGNYSGVAFGSGLFVASAGAQGVIVSPDGQAWSPAGFGVPWVGSVQSVSYANDRFYVGVNFGAVVYSTDGLDWPWGGWPANNSLHDLHFLNGLYMGVSDPDFAGANLTVSSDGWSWMQSTVAGSQSLYGITSGNNTLVVVGAQGRIATSSNGTNWTVRSSGTGASLLGVTFGNGLFVACGSAGTIATSANGVSWTLRPSGTGQELRKVTYANGVFVAVGAGGTLLTSGDGLSWTARGSGTTQLLTDVVHGNGVFVAVGENTTFVTSPDGITWSRRSAVTSNRLTSVAWGAGTFVTVGFGGTVLTSPNGGDWTTRSSATALGLYSVAYGNNTFVAVGQIILSSPDGIAWTVRDSGAGFSYENVSYVNGLFMAVGAGGSMRVSQNGITWTTRATGTTLPLYGLAYGNGLYVLTGASGVIRTSPDGTTWTPRAAGTSQDINGVTYANGQFVAQGNSGVILTSVNGMTWTLRASGTGQGLATCAYGFDRFVTVGLDGTILSSPDGAMWTLHNSGTSALLIGVAAGPDSFVAVGDGGTILESGPLDPRPRISSEPLDQTATNGATATFSVVASGMPPLQYQWRKDEGNISGANTSTYSIVGVQSNHLGRYSVTVNNAFGAVTSRVATLDLGIVPVILQPPISQAVVAGGSVTFSVEITGNPTPFDYEWRKLTPPRFTNRFVLNERTSFFTIDNVQTNHAGNYAVVVRNAALPTGVNSIFTLTLLPDSDGDGLPDDWEMVYPTAAHPAQDTDNDGATNLEEYQAGTDPTNALSVLRIDRVTAGDLATLEFPAVSNRTYTVQCREAVDLGTWSNVTSFVARSTDWTATATNPMPLGNDPRFYRLVTPRQP